MQLPNNSPYSYWELKQYFKRFDLVIIGSGIVGLSTAISFRQKNKTASILVLERGLLPNGASSKNAGFACFGSAGELLDDLRNMQEDEVWKTVQMRWNGLLMLRKRLGDAALSYKAYGGFELFDSPDHYEHCFDQCPGLNRKIKESIGLSTCYDKSHINRQFKNVAGILKNKYEGQIDTAAMMAALLKMAGRKNIHVLNNIAVTELIDLGTGVEILTDAGVFKAAQLVVATNGFARQLLDIPDVLPARAQVLVTKPIPGLKLKGAYHYQQGYYYFRNIDNRILLGGGRNMDFKGETTTGLNLNADIQLRLDQLLKDMILPGLAFEVEQRWAGIMGVGKEKSPLIKQVSPNVLAAVRMGGMGIAIGSWVGEKAAEQIS